jgi:hypothetical protein
MTSFVRTWNQDSPIYVLEVVYADETKGHRFFGSLVGFKSAYMSNRGYPTGNLNRHIPTWALHSTIVEVNTLVLENGVLKNYDINKVE